LIGEHVGHKTPGRTDSEGKVTVKWNIVETVLTIMNWGVCQRIRKEGEPLALYSI